MNKPLNQPTYIKPPKLIFEFAPTQSVLTTSGVLFCSHPLGSYSHIRERIKVVLADFRNKYYVDMLEQQHHAVATKTLAQRIAFTIVHEYMHHILHKEHGEQAGNCLDNIADKVDL